MANTITSANAVFTLSIAGLYGAPVQLQGFGVDDAFTTEAVDNAELKMGVDGQFVGGWIPMPVKMGVNFLASSPSILIFETWYNAEQGKEQKLIASGSIILPATSRQYTLTQGYLSSQNVLPDAKKTLGDRKFQITWGSITSAPA